MGRTHTPGTDRGRRMHIYCRTSIFAIGRMRRASRLWVRGRKGSLCYGMIHSFCSSKVLKYMEARIHWSIASSCACASVTRQRVVLASPVAAGN